MKKRNSRLSICAKIPAKTKMNSSDHAIPYVTSNILASHVNNHGIDCKDSHNKI